MCSRLSGSRCFAFAGKISVQEYSALGDALELRQAKYTNAHGQHHAGRVCVAHAHSARIHAGKRPAVLDGDLLGGPFHRHAHACRASRRRLRVHGVHGHGPHARALHVPARSPAGSAPPLRKSLTKRTLRVRHRLRCRADPSPAAAERFLIRPAASRGRLRVDRGRRPRRPSPTAPSTPESAELTSIG